jgi:hypothetical protein
MQGSLVRQPRHALEALAAGVVTTLGRLTSQAISPVAVAFSHPAPARTSEHARVFGSVVAFGASGSHLSFRAADLETAVPSANPVLQEVFDRHATAIVGKLDAYGPVGRTEASVPRHSSSRHQRDAAGGSDARRRTAQNGRVDANFFAASPVKAYYQD